MPKIYTPEHKELVLKILYCYQGDVVSAADFTGVPERTLRQWRKQSGIRLSLPAGVSSGSAVLTLPKIGRRHN
jgi:hypothetical protein